MSPVTSPLEEMVKEAWAMAAEATKFAQKALILGGLGLSLAIVCIGGL